MGEQQGEPLGGGEELEVAFQRGVEFGAVEDHARFRVIGHLLEREGRADHVPGQLLAALGVAGPDPDLVVDRE